jgi:hypothetical protein
VRFSSSFPSSVERHRCAWCLSSDDSRRTPLGESSVARSVSASGPLSRDSDSSRLLGVVTARSVSAVMTLGGLLWERALSRAVSQRQGLFLGIYYSSRLLGVVAARSVSVVMAPGGRL